MHRDICNKPNEDTVVYNNMQYMDENTIQWSSHIVKGICTFSTDITTLRYVWIL